MIKTKKQNKKNKGRHLRITFGVLLVAMAAFFAVILSKGIVGHISTTIYEGSSESLSARGTSSGLSVAQRTSLDGEGVQQTHVVHGSRIIVGNYIFFGTCSWNDLSEYRKARTLYRCNLNNLNDCKTVKFPDDGLHMGISDLSYKEGTRDLYVAFRSYNQSTYKKSMLVLVNTDTLSWKDVATMENYANGNIEIAGNYIYAITQSNPTYLYRWNISHLKASYYTPDTVPNSKKQLSKSGGHGLEYDGKHLYGTNSSGDGLTVWKINPSDLSVVNEISLPNKIDGKDCSIGTHEFDFWGDYLFVGMEGTGQTGFNPIVRINKNNLSDYKAIWPEAYFVGSNWGVKYYDNYIWGSYGSRPGKIVRLDPNTLATKTFSLSEMNTPINGPVTPWGNYMFVSFLPSFYSDASGTPSTIAKLGKPQGYSSASCSCTGTDFCKKPVSSNVCNSQVCGQDGHYYKCTASGYAYAGGTCSQTCTTTQKCSDGTAYNQCSSTKPKYCSSGSLVNKCSSCGCPSGQTCQSDGTCKTSSSPSSSLPTNLYPNNISIYGTTTWLFWRAPLGITKFGVRVEDQTNPSTSRFSQNTCSNHYVCINGYGSTSLTIPVIKGHQYLWWVHAINSSNQWSSAAMASFTVK